MAIKKEPKIIQLLPAENWFSVYMTEEGGFCAERVLAFALVEDADGWRRVDAFSRKTPYELSVGGDFLQFCHRDELERVLRDPDSVGMFEIGDMPGGMPGL